MKNRHVIVSIIILYSLLIGQGITTEAQTPAGIFKVDALTYRFYLEQKWDSLTRIGKTGLREGIDFYYLRMRMGIAYYEKHNYALAIKHFRKALQFDPTSKIAMEYLYYCFLFLKRDMDAHLAETMLPSESKENLGIQSQFIYGFSVDYTYRTFRPTSYAFPLSAAPDGSQQIPEQAHDLSLLFKQFPGKRVRLFHSFTNFRQQSVYYEKTTGKDYLFESWLNQFQYYLNISFRPYPGIIFSTWGHYLYLHYPFLYERNNSRMQTVFAYQGEYLAGISASITGGLFSVNYSYNRSWFKELQIQQFTTGIGIYPYGNLNLYGIYKAHFLNQISEKRFHIIHQKLIGLKISPKFWTEIGLSSGNMHHFADAMGYLVYNQENPYSLLASATIYYVPSPGWIINIKGSCIKGESRFTSSEIFSNQVDFKSYSITGGVSWKL